MPTQTRVGDFLFLVMKTTETMNITIIKAIAPYKTSVGNGVDAIAGAEFVGSEDEGNTFCVGRTEVGVDSIFDGDGVGVAEAIGDPNA